MNSKPLADATVRQALVENLHQNYFVEAGAGSGKTTSLIGRMIALVRTGTCPLTDIAAITFTRKAAGELKERLQIELEKSLQAETDPVVTTRLLTALSQLDQCYVGTIHSFCATLLRERPVEAGLDPAFETIEGIEERLLEKQAWDQFMVQQYLYHPDRLQQLKDIDLDPRQLFDAYRTMNLYPEVAKPCNPVPYPEIGQVRQHLLDFAREAATNMPAGEPKQGWDALQVKVRKIFNWNRVFNLEDDLVLFRLLADLDSRQAKIIQNRWRSGPQAKELYNAYDKLNEGEIKPLLTAWREYRYPFIMDFLAAASEAYQQMRSDQNCLNYQDLLMHCAQMLGNNSEVRAYFQQRFPRLLVDEFQDTDPIQAEIMMYLTGHDCSEPDWTRLLPRPGTLFVVGDPKQSIYRFRRADIDTFHQVRRQIQQAGGEIAVLSSNFRSTPGLVDWFNETFADLFATSDPPYQAGYGSMSPAREDTSAGAMLNILNLTDTFPGEKPGAEEDAEQVAAFIQTMLEDSRKKLAPEDFLLLMHYKKHMLLYAGALRRAGIPFTISGGSDLSNSLLVEEFHYVLQAVDDPGNPLALVACLRGLCFGFSDQELYEFKQAGGRFNFLATVPDGAVFPAHENWQAAFDSLKQMRHWSQTLPPSAALEQMMVHIGLIPFAMTLETGSSDVAALLQLLELIRDMEEDGITRFTEIVAFIQTLLDDAPEDAIDIEGGRQPGVRIMNLHKAKGLEAPVVILANPMGNSKHTPSYYVARNGKQSEGYFQISRQRSTYSTEILAQPQAWETLCATETEYQDAEAIRLLYVAATRARDLLVVCTTSKPDKSPWGILEEYLCQAAPVQVDVSHLDVSVPPGQDATPVSLENLRQSVQEPIQLLASPSYSRATITDLVKGKQDSPLRQATGKGVSWGSVIHRVLQRLVKDLELIDNTDWITELLEQEGRPADECEQVQAQLRGIMSTPLWQRIQASETILTEVPFGIKEGNTYLTGTIDLVFKEAGGWVIIDYKTDTILDDKHFSELTSYYQPQVEAYKRYWEAITGEQVAEVRMFFTEGEAQRFT